MEQDRGAPSHRSMEFLLRAASKQSRAAKASPKYEERILALARDVAFDRVRQFRATSMPHVDVIGFSSRG